jgi:hypothetical protein
MQPELSYEVFTSLAKRVEQLGGAFDTHTASIAGFCIPVRSREAARAVFEDFVAAARQPVEWLFSERE